ncbi:hypothetical protein KAFR_0I01940 [Kazachstania africana CBS 2517]|uniref:Uncharacterized protein n=1 Tax=Kazachstania africana (strain ATCC 22294 / BCRC 22015 / CBS 2517 / CECT 1963 / NBRC 1671 / NRRL Y-8276) TaxID=1071382 RepID=H2B024_KAZAF|nr:hypothetical protein KAFR_0I01940 [Kazachstania africana CBS 2517]CCF59974.1 hypothetical protein KAFR_0I01940 [Kazachstania africana CBS 2517]
MPENTIFDSVTDSSNVGAFKTYKLNDSNENSNVTIHSIRKQLNFHDDKKWKNFIDRRLELINQHNLGFLKASQQRSKVNYIADILRVEYGYPESTSLLFEKLVINGIQSIRRNRKRCIKRNSEGNSTASSLVPNLNSMHHGLSPLEIPSNAIPFIVPSNEQNSSTSLRNENSMAYTFVNNCNNAFGAPNMVLPQSLNVANIHKPPFYGTMNMMPSTDNYLLHNPTLNSNFMDIPMAQSQFQPEEAYEKLIKDTILQMINTLAPLQRSDKNGTFQDLTERIYFYCKHSITCQQIAQSREPLYQFDGIKLKGEIFVKELTLSTVKEKFPSMLKTQINDFINYLFSTNWLAQLSSNILQPPVGEVRVAVGKHLLFLVVGAIIHDLGVESLNYHLTSAIFYQLSLTYPTSNIENVSSILPLRKPDNDASRGSPHQSLLSITGPELYHEP